MYMRKDKGISMISLVVTIIVTVILAGFAIVIGSKYLKESRKKNTEVSSIEKEALTLV